MHILVACNVIRQEPTLHACLLPKRCPNVHLETVHWHHTTAVQELHTWVVNLQNKNFEKLRVTLPSLFESSFLQSLPLMPVFVLRHLAPSV
jgi:hypothetical protein